MIICTAGHVDHGKTTLLHALTGTHTAHLPEEKKRGLTIDLGYAYLPIGDRVLGFIDVPGHQKFLSNMLAGLGGLQHAMLIVSAEEGIKPQTEEHLAILQLLDFPHIMVVITKADRANENQINQLKTILAKRLPTSKLFVTSAHTGQGITELKSHLSSLYQQKAEQERPFRYAIDRVFHIKGVGLVVTGTAVNGQVQLGDELYLSNGEKVRVKNIHAQNRESEKGIAGQRLALNLAGIEKSDIQRGDWLSQLKPDFPTERISVKLSTQLPMKENSIVHLYHFASHITGKVNLLNASQAATSQSYLAEILLDEPLHVAVGDKWIIRNGDDSLTLAGAQTLEIHSPKRHKRTENRLALLTQLSDILQDNESAAAASRTALYLQHHAINLEELAWREQIFIQQAVGFGEKYANWLLGNHFRQKLQQRLVEKLTEYHTQHNDQLGVTKARLYRIAALEQPEKLVYQIIEELLESGLLAQTRGWIHTPNHRIEFNAGELQIWQQVRPIFEATNQALWVRDIAVKLSVEESTMRNLLYKAGKLGYLVPIVKDRFLTFEQTTAFAELIKQFILQYGEISVNQLRDEIGYGRKLTVQLIEYFDRSGFLRRKGNVHLLRDSETY